MGCGPRARSVLHCHGVLAQRRGPVTGAVQDASQLQEDASWQLAVQKGRQSQGLELVSSHFSLHISPSLPWCFSPAKGSCDRSCAGRKPAARGRRQVRSWHWRKPGAQDTSWQLAVQKGRQSQGLELVSRQFRKQRLAVWAASLPLCFSPAKGSCDRSCGGRKPAARGRRQVRSWHCRKPAGQDTSWQLAVQKGRQSQGSELVSRQFRKQRLAVWAAGRGPDPSLTATVF